MQLQLSRSLGRAAQGTGRRVPVCPRVQPRGIVATPGALPGQPEQQAQHSAPAPNRIPRSRLHVRAQAAPATAGTQLYTSVAAGKPEPLGPSKTASGVNFALFSKNAKSVKLVLLDGEAKQLAEVDCKRSGDVWHVELQGLPGSGVRYGFKVAGDGGWETGHRWNANRVLLDPYAPLVAGRRWFGKRDAVEQFKGKDGSLFLGAFDFDSPAYDWGSDYQRPTAPLKDLIIYEVPVRCFTADPSSGLPEAQRGTFAGLAAKAKYLQSLGINAVELLPVFEWDELEFRRSQNPRDHMTNVWGYSHISFHAPMSRLGSEGSAEATAREFKDMVKTLHAHGIQVLLDVVYNHTAEADDRDPYLLTLRGIDNSTYYMLDPGSPVQLVNWSGCGNTVNANHPVVSQLIIDSLVRWVTEYHVDGFRFDLASCLCRDERGRPMAVPPVIRNIAKHPLLSQVKLIAEPWDIGMYQVGTFPNWDIWAEWNGKYRDDVRRFIKGDAGMKGAFATRLAGSADLYGNNNRRPFHSINFITAHDGFSLYDMVSYNEKRNGANGEGNRDGTNDNFSWNCGAEGETGDAGIKALRQRQMRNCMVALMLSQGTPMIVSGDEVGKTHGGNNNWYGHDNPMSHLQWNEGDATRDALLRFCSELFAFRRSHPALGREHFLGPQDITWHENNWDNSESRFLAFTLHHKEAGDIYAAFNAHGFSVDAHLPKPPAGRKWCRLVDTNLPTPKDFTPGGNAGVEPVYNVQAFSSIVLLAKPV
ncbi:hypothetical protein HYH03_004392 [Edaphochlamys debaryana]|uniref:isoamylase n=1 Tax=Edaphochlamys debaryana TaxID=47281 RepID=A0A836C3B9_9CHLO|nr:hypothetical protein HYH03_004392 [Edaphochlamys debaryana]|eukprot:KAG2497653.1 hypothetical protein HYH03_004392 [Edaphochlamys debaryana]